MLFHFCYLFLFISSTICWYEPPHDKTTKWHVRPAKTQISLGICPVWSESSLCSQWIAKDLIFLDADSKDSDPTGRMPRLIWSSLDAHVILLVLSRGGSYRYQIILSHHWITPEHSLHPIVAQLDMQLFHLRTCFCTRKYFSHKISIFSNFYISDMKMCKD